MSALSYGKSKLIIRARNISIDGKESAYPGHSLYVPYPVHIGRRDPVLIYDPVVGKSAVLEKSIRIFSDGHPFGIETYENPDTQSDKKDHRNELDFIYFCSSP